LSQHEAKGKTNRASDVLRPSKGTFILVRLPDALKGATGGNKKKLRHEEHRKKKRKDAGGVWAWRESSTSGLGFHEGVRKEARKGRGFLRFQ